MPSVERSARFIDFTPSAKSGLVVKYQAHFIAAKPNDLLAALNVMLLLTTSRFSSVLNGVYFTPLLMKSQWISSDSTITRFLRQISPMCVKSDLLQALPVG